MYGCIRNALRANVFDLSSYQYSIIIIVDIYS